MNNTMKHFRSLLCLLINKNQKCFHLKAIHKSKLKKFRLAMRKMNKINKICYLHRNLNSNLRIVKLL